MKMRIALPLLFALLCLTLSAVPAMAGSDPIIYSNGGPVGFVGWSFSNTVVSDTVSCASAGGCTPTDLQIWIVGDQGHPLPSLTSFTWSFSTAENSGTGLGSGIADSTTGLVEAGCTKSVPAVCSVTTNLVPLTPFVKIPAGVSWLNLFNAGGNVPMDILWNQNNGPSAASTIINGKFVDIPSEAFNVSGTSAVPEPGSILLLGTGIVGFAGVLRRKLKL
jgi:PEP-CTERM motif